MVFLFDIDGTLLHGHGVGRRAVERVLATWAGRAIDTEAVSFSGKTDPQIFREIVTTPAAVGTAPDDVEAVVAQLLDAYAADVTATIGEARVEALPGAHEAVRRTLAAGIPVGLLTGNLQPMAALKVQRVGFAADAFPFGAYGSDHPDRNCLAPIAARRAAAFLGRDVRHEELVVVGDTPLDIACARVVGARAVGVTTGHYDAAALSDADLVLDSLADFDPEALRPA